MTANLCEHCRHCKPVISGKGSRFLLCLQASVDERYSKYPPQPVVRCAGFELVDQSPPNLSPPSGRDVP